MKNFTVRMKIVAFECGVRPYTRLKLNQLGCAATMSGEPLAHRRDSPKTLGGSASGIEAEPFRSSWRQSRIDLAAARFRLSSPENGGELGEQFFSGIGLGEKAVDLESLDFRRVLGIHEPAHRDHLR